MADYKILFLDIDGTILKPDHTIEESTRLAVQEAQKSGLEVFLATGRPLHEVADIADTLNVHSFIGYNGAYAIFQDKVVFDRPLKEEIVDHFIQMAKKHNHDMILYTNEKNYYTAMDSPAVLNFIDKFQLKKNAEFHAGVKDKILGVTIMGANDEEIADYRSEEDLHFAQVNVPGLEDCYDVIRDSVNKGIAITKILQLSNLPKESAVAFGDGLNDKEMLQSVGTGVAMGNAHPLLFDYAKFSTTAVTDSGIYNGLAKLGIVASK